MSIGYYVISCANCIAPGVYIYGHDLEFHESFGMDSQNATINLAIYEDTKYRMTLFVAGSKSIDVIQMQENTKGDVAW